MKRYSVLAALACVVLFSISCKQDNAEADTSAKNETEETKEERVPVEVAEVGRGSIEAVVRSSSNLEAEASVQVFAKTSGRAVELLVEEGDAVEKNQPVLRLEDDTQKIQVAKAKARVTKAELEYNRTNDLYKKEMVTSQEYNNAAYELEQARLELTEAKQNLSYTTVYAPITGTLTARMVNLGDMVSTGSPIFDIVDFDSIVARLYLPEKNLAQLSLGQTARLTSRALGNTEYTGTIKRIAPTVDARTGTVKVTVGVGNLEGLRPGMFVDVSLILAVHDDAVLIPKRALVYDNDQTFVFRVIDGEEMSVERVSVMPLLADRDFIEPIDGIQEGDSIVISGHTGLKDGSKVRLVGDTTPMVEMDQTTRTAEVAPQ